MYAQGIRPRYVYKSCSSASLFFLRTPIILFPQHLPADLKGRSQAEESRHGHQKPHKDEEPFDGVKASGGDGCVGDGGDDDTDDDL